MRAPDKAVFDNSVPTTLPWRQPALACRSGLRQGCYAHFPAAGPPGSSRSLVRTCIKELEAAGAAFLSSPPAVLRWRGKFSFPRGLIALFALLAHHFFSCSVTGKPLPATTHAGCVATSVYPLGIRVSGHDFRGHGKIHVLYQGTTFSRAIND